MQFGLSCGELSMGRVGLEWNLGLTIYDFFKKKPEH